jgi:signal transduction histidine kinase
MKMKKSGIQKRTLLFLMLFSGWVSCPSLVGQESTIRDMIDEAIILEGKSDFQGAMQNYNQALTLIDQRKEMDTTAFLLRKKGTCFLYLGNYDSARHYLSRSIDLASRTQNLQVLGDAENSIAYIYRIRAQLDSSKLHFLRAYHLFETINDTMGMAKVGHNLSAFYLKSADYDTALLYALQSNKTIRNSGNKPFYMRSLIQLGNVYEELHNDDSALSCYNLAFELSQEIGNEGVANTIMINKGVIYYKKHDLDSSKAYFLEAMDYAEKLNNPINLALIYSNLSGIYFSLDEPILSLHYGKKALVVVERSNNTEQKISVYNNLGKAYLKSGDLGKAISYFSACRDTAIHYKYLEDLKKAYVNLSTVYATQGNFEDAFSQYKKSDSVATVIMDIEKMKTVKELNAKYELIKLNDEISITELRIKKTRLERNMIFAVSVFVVSLLIWLALFYSMRLKKNRIISNQKIKQLEDEKKLLAAQSVIVGQEEERKRIARELHDGIGVLLSTAKIRFSSLEDEKADDRTSGIFKKAYEMLDKAGKEVRRISHDMMPGVLSKFGLREALEDLFEDLENMTDMQIEVDMQCSHERLPDNLEIMLYRVVQELINNTIKHAGATKISCMIKRTADAIEIDYADNGKGFDEKSLPHNKSLGIFGIRSRIDFLSGTVKLESGEGKGTRFVIHVPLKQDIKRDVSRR